MSNPSTESAPASPQFVLASQGRYYKSGSGQATVRPVTGEHEAMLADADPKTFPEVLDAVIRECVVEIPVPDFDQLLVGDKYHMMFQIRAISYRKYGDDYKFTVTCPRCKEPNRVTKHLSEDVHIKHPPEDATEPFPVELPVCGRTARMRLLRVMDEIAMIKFVRREKAKARAARESRSNSRTRPVGISATRGDPAYLYAMAAGIDSLDGDLIDVDEAFHFVRKCAGDDTLAMRDALDDMDVGMELVQEYVCEECGEYWWGKLPIDADFFRPGSADRRRASFPAV